MHKEVMTVNSNSAKGVMPHLPFGGWCQSLGSPDETVSRKAVLR